jgi:hypothetical protein
VTILCLVVLVVGVVLCGVLAEPWQRPRYDRLAERGLDQVDEWAEELRREARDG